MHRAAPLAAMVFSGPLERYPALRIVLAETGIGWLPYMIERMDYPHADSTWQTPGRPSRTASRTSRRRILCDNARELYGL